MSFSTRSTVLNRDWLIMEERPMYAPPPVRSYYRSGERLELDDDARHLRVVRFQAAPAEDPALDW